MHMMDLIINYALGRGRILKAKGCKEHIKLVSLLEKSNHH